MLLFLRILVLHTILHVIVHVRTCAVARDYYMEFSDNFSSNTFEIAAIHFKSNGDINVKL